MVEVKKSQILVVEVKKSQISAVVEKIQEEEKSQVAKEKKVE